jgi:spermidine/putrescine-binding protein
MLLATALVAVACSNGSTASSTGAASGSVDPASITGTIRLLSYSDGFDPGYLAAFEQQYPNITIDSSSMGSNEEAIAKIQAGFDADVVNSCVDEATLEMDEKGIYAPLDQSRLTHWNDLFPSMQALPGVQYNGQIYMVPVDAGTSGIVYNADVVTTPPTSWTDLFDPQWEGRAGMEDIAVTAFMIGALANGIQDPINMDQTQIDQVKQYLIDHKSEFRTFWKGDAEVKSLFKSGEIVISSGYPDTAKALRHHARRRPREPRRGVRAAQLLLQPRSRAVRSADVELPDREHEDARPRVAGADQGGVLGGAVPPRERDPGEPACQPRRVGRRLDRGQGQLAMPGTR